MYYLIVHAFFGLLGSTTIRKLTAWRKWSNNHSIKHSSLGNTAECECITVVTHFQFSPAGNGV